MTLTVDPSTVTFSGVLIAGSNITLTPSGRDDHNCSLSIRWERRLCFAASATVTIQAGKGITTTTLTVSGLSPGVMHSVSTSSNVVTALVSLSTEVTGILPLSNMVSSVTVAGNLVAGSNITLIQGAGITTIAATGGGGGGSGGVNSGTLGQNAYYAVAGTTVSGSSNMITNASSETFNVTTNHLFGLSASTMTISSTSTINGPLTFHSLMTGIVDNDNIELKSLTPGVATNLDFFDSNTFAGALQKTTDNRISLIATGPVDSLCIYPTDGHIAINTETGLSFVDPAAGMAIYSNSNTDNLMIKANGTEKLIDFENNSAVTVASITALGEASFVNVQASNELLSNIGVFNSSVTVARSITASKLTTTGDITTSVGNINATIGTANIGGLTTTGGLTSNGQIAGFLVTASTNAARLFGIGPTGPLTTIDFSNTGVFQETGYIGLQTDPITTTNTFIVMGGNPAKVPAGNRTNYFYLNISTQPGQTGNVGIGISNPSSTLEVGGTGLSVVTTSTQSSIINNGLIVYGRVITSTATPIISACGSTPNGSVVGNDIDGKITIGGGIVTSCTMTFGGPPWPNAPSCTTLSNTAITSPTGSTTTTAFTLGAGATFNGDVIMYHCSGYQ